VLFSNAVLVLTRVLLTALPFLLCFTDAQAAELYEQQALLVSMPCCKYRNYRCTNIRVNISRSSVGSLCDPRVPLNASLWFHALMCFYTVV
jgi:hypothetical protein